MKKIIAYLILSCFAICVYGFSRNLSITTKDSNSSFRFKASYPKNKTLKVIDYVEAALKADQISIGADNKKNMDILLIDGTKFHLKSHLGFIEIKLDKKENSSASYQKVKNISLGIREVLAK